MNNYRVYYSNGKITAIADEKTVFNDLGTYVNVSSPFDFKEGDIVHTVNLSYVRDGENVKEEVVGIYPTTEYYSNMMLTIISLVQWNKDLSDRPDSFIRYPLEIDKFTKDQLMMIDWRIGDVFISHETITFGEK